MTKFSRSNENSNLVALTIGVTIHVSRAELDNAHTTGEVFALANEKKAEAHDALNRAMSALAIEIEGARRLFVISDVRHDEESREGAPV
jgi:hypothetical protein